jgi:hypothetical protein
MITNEKLEYKDWLIEHLPKGPVTVTFKKVDGTTRIMECTTSPTHILFRDPDSIEKSGKVNQSMNHLCVVYDLKSNGWRSFRWDSIMNVGLE